MNWEFALTLAEKDELVDPGTVRGIQFIRPLLEFNGACPGCGETPYIRLLTQLFGDRMMISNATGCSSIWGASAPSIAYTVNREGRGPAWINPLFEDAAEFGLGMLLGVKQAREKLAELMRQALQEDLPEKIKAAFGRWLEVKDDGEASRKLPGKWLFCLTNMATAMSCLSGLPPAGISLSKGLCGVSAATAGPMTSVTAAWIIYWHPVKILISLLWIRKFTPIPAGKAPRPPCRLRSQT